jgi:hypothetical protein
MTIKAKSLNIKLELEPAARGEYSDCYYAQEGEWFVEIRVPKGERPDAVNIHFEFGDSEVKRNGK